MYNLRPMLRFNLKKIFKSINYLLILSLSTLLRNETRSLMGSSFYDLIHPADLKNVIPSIKELFCKGHCLTPFYRMIRQNNTIVWTQTEATTVNQTTRGQKNQYVLCVHSVLGYFFSLNVL